MHKPVDKQWMSWGYRRLPERSAGAVAVRATDALATPVHAIIAEAPPARGGSVRAAVGADPGDEPVHEALQEVLGALVADRALLVDQPFLEVQEGLGLASTGMSR